MQLNPIFSRRHTVALVFAICHFTLIGQDLLLNAGFEHHSTFSDYAEPHESNFDYLKNWDVLGLDVSNYCHSDLEEKRVKEFQTCANSIHPHGGKGMVKLLYVEACPEISRITGCASYIHSKLQSALVVGNIYEVIMWVYFPCQSGIDSSIFSNIGFYLSLEPERLGPHELFRTEYFFSDRIEECFHAIPMLATTNY